MSDKQITEEASSQTHSLQSPVAATGINQFTVWLLSIASAMTVANLYYSQPLLAEIAKDFSVSAGTVGFIATVTQLGYALGLLFVVPLGDAIDRRKLISLSLIAVTLSLLATALAPSIGILAVASFALGATTVIPQIILPFAASLAHPEARGRVLGKIMSGLLIGILLARTISGFVGAHLSWRTMYWVAAIMMIGLLCILRAFLPKEEPRESLSYPDLLRSLWELLRTQPILREVSLFGALVFAAFQVFWVTLAFYLGSNPYHFGSDVVGLFGLVGIVGAIAASFLGKQVDRTEPRLITGIMLTILLVTFLLFWLFGQALWGLILGVILLDLGTQGMLISNQARFYSLIPEARSRLNTVYMVSYFTGGTLGSILGDYGWSLGGWSGVCAMGMLLVAAAIVTYGIGSWRKARS